MTTDDKPAPEHPAPTMPTDFGHVYECVACDEPSLPLDPPQFTPDRRRAKRGMCAIHAAAPEMAALLREMYDSQAIVMDGEINQVRDLRRDGMRRGFEKIGPLLARIDAAGKAGT